MVRLIDYSHRNKHSITKTHENALEIHKVVQETNTGGKCPSRQGQNIMHNSIPMAKLSICSDNKKDSTFLTMKVKVKVIDDLAGI